MKVDTFDFELPENRIAHRPAVPRDSARLLVSRSNGVTEHRIFRDLPDLLCPGDLLLLNNTRVIPGFLEGWRRDAKVSITLLGADDNGYWNALARPARRLAPEDRIQFADGFFADVIALGGGGEVLLKLSTGNRTVEACLATHGKMPIPPYIRRTADSADQSDYQTVYAEHPGAVAAPTAGLHFTDALLAELASRGVAQEFVTLHVGVGTFRPVRVDDTDDHRMYAEFGRVPVSTVDAIRQTRRSGGRVVAVGTTCVRLIESAVADDGSLQPFTGNTDLFITPGFRFRVVDLLITNFHLPRSTLFMLVSAFAGTDRMMSLYRDAIEKEYRFYSYGDACLLEPARVPF